MFFALGAAISGATRVSLLDPGGWLEPMWRLNPRAREQFAGMGHWGPILMGVVSAACALAALGLWRRRRYGWLLGMTLLAVSLLGDGVNAALGLEPRAWIGVPVAALLLVVLARSRGWFASS